MTQDKQGQAPLAVSRVEELRADRSDQDLARLLWTALMLRRMRSAAQRAARTPELAPMEVVLARAGLRRGAR